MKTGSARSRSERSKPPAPRASSSVDEFPAQILKRLHEAILVPRLIEEKMLLLLRQGRLSKWFSGIGQEAIAVGVAFALENDDWILPMHRNLGVFTTRGVDLSRLLRQLFGKQDGFTKGRDRTFHFGSLEHRIVGMISHLGAMLPVADGLALAAQLRGERRIAAAFTGEGATSEGDFHEALNLAAVWKLPVLFIVENNLYGLSTPIAEQFACRDLADRAAGYGMEGEVVDGNDVLAVMRTVRRAAERARRGEGPTLLEFKTFRMRGHEEASGTAYVPARLFEEWGRKDPVARFEKHLLEQGVISPADRDAVRARIAARIDALVDEALSAPEPSSTGERELADVYAAAPRGPGGAVDPGDAAHTRGVSIQQVDNRGNGAGALPETAHETPGAAEPASTATATAHETPGAAEPASTTTATAHAASGEGEVRELRYVDAISEGLREAMRRDPRIVLLGQDIAEYGGVFKITRGFLEEFGRARVRNTPIIESGALGTALGLALDGFVPMVEMQFGDFITCGFNQIVNNIAKTHYRWGAGVPMVIRAPIGGGVGAGPFHSQNIEAWFTHVAGLKVVAPASPADAKGLLIAAFADGNPVIYLEHKFLYRSARGPVAPGASMVPIGKARVAREGTDATIVTWGAGVSWALESAAGLETAGRAIEVVDLRSLLPWDLETVLASVKKTARALVLHEAPILGGFGAEIAATIGREAFAWLDAPVMRAGSLDTPVPFSPRLEEVFSARGRLDRALDDLLSW